MTKKPMQALLLCAVLAPVAIAADATSADLCPVLRDPTKLAGKLIVVKGFIKPLMHGTYLKQVGCEDSMLLVLPGEIPNYKGSVTAVKDAEFGRFLDARYNYLPDAPVYFAEFTGQLDYAKSGRGFGFNKNHRTRLVLRSVAYGELRKLPPIL